MIRIRRAHGICAALSSLGALVACQTTPAPSEPAPASPFHPPSGELLEGEGEGLEEAYAIAARVARERRQQVAAQGFAAFEASVPRDPGGKYIVNGDIAISERKQLQEFFETQIAQDAADVLRGSLVVARSGGQDAVWNSNQKRLLTYCVSTSFGTRQAAAVAAMDAATRAWEEIADVNFAHAPAQDASCTASNANVVFDVRPVTNGGYLARAFFPNEPRSARNVLIDDTSFALDPPPAKLQLAGILRHELGHTLGFRHEHTRPEAGTCFEDNEWRPLTSYDALSVMHYPQCNGGGDWTLALTERDKNGAACLYGAAPGFTVNPALCLNPPEPVEPDCGERTRTFSSQSVAKDAEKAYGPFAVKAGTRFEATLKGRGTSPGDPDLYLRFGQRPTRTSYSCRPYLSGADESCALDVPAATTQAFVMVRGYAAGSYDLTIVHTP